MSAPINNQFAKGNKGGGRKSIKEEKSMYLQLQKFTPSIVGFYYFVLSDQCKDNALKERVSRTILNKLIPDKRLHELEDNQDHEIKVVMVDSKQAETKED